MPTDMLQSPVRSPARNFVAGALAYSVVVFGLLKLGWVESHVLLPLTQWQGRLAQATMGVPALPIDVTLACSGADAFALCAGAIMAYPAAWRLRLGGTAAGLALIVVLNSIRIGTLGRVAASPVLFETLHVYVWPAVLILAIAGFVFGWMQWVNSRSAVPIIGHAPAVAPMQLTRTFVLWTVVFVFLFVALSSLYLQSGTVLIVASFIARRAADALRLMGMQAVASANILWTPKGGFEVTQECISTPLIPLYFAAIMTYCPRWHLRVAGFAAALPLFVALGIVRLLVVALPEAVVGSPLFLIHAFYQILLAAFVVGVAVVWQRGASAWRIGLLACVAGVICAYLLSPVYDRVLSLSALDIRFHDAQGALASMPAFQAGLFVALSVATMTVIAWRRFLTGVAVLGFVQLLVFGALYAASRYSDLAIHIREVRAWAIVAPLAIVVAGLISHDRPRR